MHDLELSFCDFRLLVSWLFAVLGLAIFEVGVPAHGFSASCMFSMCSAGVLLAQAVHLRAMTALVV